MFKPTPDYLLEVCNAGHAVRIGTRPLCKLTDWSSKSCSGERLPEPHDGWWVNLFLPRKQLLKPFDVTDQNLLSEEVNFKLPML